MSRTEERESLLFHPFSPHHNQVLTETNSDANSEPRDARAAEVVGSWRGIRGNGDPFGCLLARLHCQSRNE